MRLRLLKVTVQPVFVLDDGENITEQVAEPFTVAAADWRGFADVGGRFDAAVEGLTAQVAAPTGSPQPVPSDLT